MTNKTNRVVSNDNAIYDFASSKNAKQVLKHFHSSMDGLAQEDVIRSREHYGDNTITPDKKDTLLKKVMKAFFTPFTMILIALAGISYITDYAMAAPAEKDGTAVIIILAMVTLSGLLTLIQTAKSTDAAEKLTSMVKVTATVVRQGEGQREIDINELVCGDIIHLSAGDMIPADVRLIKSKDLFISQSAMTGESHPVEKTVETDGVQVESVTDYQNIVFMGSNVVSGAAFAVVINTGDHTLFGKIARDVANTDVKTSFELGISSVSWLLIRFMAVMTPTVFIINGLTKGDWVEAFLFGVSVAVGLTPEMLPMIVTSNLVKGANGMAKEGTIIKNLNSIQNFGAIDVLCTDKTGTLTQDKIILEYHLDLDGNEDADVLHHAFLNSYYQTGLKNLMDHAIITAADEELDINIGHYEKVDEIPFDFQRRRMSVVIKDAQNDTQLITKGAVEEMLSISSKVQYKGEIVPLTEDIKTKILATVDELNTDGLRVIGIAKKVNPPKVDEFSIKDESEMVLIGYLAFLDPPKESAIDALKALDEHGVNVKVLTGDNEMVTRSVCKQVGIPVDIILSGSDLDGLSDAEYDHAIVENNIFVKLSPQQKTQIVNRLKELDHTVGFMGDGINDAAAMKAADVGISVDTAVDIAKESADVILLEKDLMILEKGLIAGRVVFGNIIKYIKMTASSNFGNMFSVLVASIFLPFLPMLPIQLLFLNLIYDISCISLPWDNMDKEYIEDPKNWSADSVGSFMVWFGPTSSVFDITTYLLMFYLIAPQVAGGQFHTLDASGQALFLAVFHAGWFVESLWSQTLVIHALRTPKVPFFQSNASFVVTTITSVGILIGTVLPYTGLGAYLKMVPLPMNYFFWLALTIVLYIALVQLVKKFYIKKYGELL